jgi:hypothetical protein
MADYDMEAGTYPMLGRDEFTAEQEKAMRQARAARTAADGAVPPTSRPDCGCRCLSQC